MAPELRTERELSLDFLRVTEAAAIAAARTMGQGDRKYSDQVAVEAMREVMDTVPMRGRVVIGEGERDEAPMLFIGEEVGGGFGVGEEMAASCPEVDIAVDPLEGTNLCALGANNAIAVLAAAERGGLVARAGHLHGQDCRRALIARSRRHRRARERQPEEHRAAAGSRYRRPDDHCSRSASATKRLSTTCAKRERAFA